MVTPPFYKQVMRSGYRTGFARYKAESARPGHWNGLIGLWMPTLGDSGFNLYDHSGFHHDGVITGADWALADGNRVLRFTNDSVNIGTDPVFNFLNRLPFSVELILSDTGSSSTFDRILSREFVQTDDQGWAVIVDNDTDVYLFNRKEANLLDEINLPYTSGQINHIFFTYDGDDMRGYLNGALAVGPTASTKNIQVVTEPLTIGVLSDLRVALRWDGDLTKLAIYNRAITPKQILEHYMDPFGIVRRRRLLGTSTGAPLTPDTNPMAPRISMSVPIGARSYRR